MGKTPHQVLGFGAQSPRVQAPGAEGTKTHSYQMLMI